MQNNEKSDYMRRLTGFGYKSDRKPYEIEVTDTHQQLYSGICDAISKNEKFSVENTDDGTAILSLASSHGNFEIAKYIIDNNLYNHRADRVLIDAFNNGYLDIVDYFVLKNPDMIGRSFGYLLMIICRDANLPLLKYLVGKGADTSCFDERLRSLSYSTHIYKCTKQIELLKYLKLYISGSIVQFVTTAIFFQNFEFIRIMCDDLGAIKNDIDKIMTCALSNPNINICNYFVNLVKDTDLYPMYLLWHACIFGFYDTVVEYSHYISHDNIKQNFIGACVNNNIMIVKYLLENFTVDRDIIGTNFRFVCKKSNVEMIEYLTQNGFDIMSDIDMSYFMAVKNGNLDLIKYMNEKKWIDSVSTQILSEAYIEACYQGHLHIVQYVQTFHDYDTSDALVKAVCGKNLDMVKYLMEHGAAINHQSYMAVIYSSMLDLIDILTYLLSQITDRKDFWKKIIMSNLDMDKLSERMQDTLFSFQSNITSVTIN